MYSVLTSDALACFFNDYLMVTDSDVARGMSCMKNTMTIMPLWNKFAEEVCTRMTHILCSRYKMYIALWCLCVCVRKIFYQKCIR